MDKDRERLSCGALSWPAALRRKAYCRIESFERGFQLLAASFQESSSADGANDWTEISDEKRRRRIIFPDSQELAANSPARMTLSDSTKKHGEKDFSLSPCF
jgi:hypothetical protein